MSNRPSFTAHNTNLRTRAYELGLRGADIAQRMGVSGPTVSMWLLKSRPVPIDRVKELAAILQLPIRDVVPDAVLELITAIEAEAGALTQQQEQSE